MAESDSEKRREAFKRVVKERQALFSRMRKLDAFFGTDTFKALPDMERMLLDSQFMTMGTYCNILDIRLKLYEEGQ